MKNDSNQSTYMIFFCQHLHIFFQIIWIELQEKRKNFVPPILVIGSYQILDWISNFEYFCKHNVKLDYVSNYKNIKILEEKTKLHNNN